MDSFESSILEYNSRGKNATDGGFRLLDLRQEFRKNVPSSRRHLYKSIHFILGIERFVGVEEGGATGAGHSITTAPMSYPNRENFPMGVTKVQMEASLEFKPAWDQTISHL